ncbi:MAG: alpha-galactosidase [Clostridia bacterium]|nr:alpha-galactosidase [Clostridia bacterium]
MGGKKVLREAILGDMLLRYEQDTERGTVGMQLVPRALAERTVEKDCAVEPLIQAKLVGDAYAGGYAQGRTMRAGETVRRMALESCALEEVPEAVTGTTVFRDEARALRWTHRLQWRRGSLCVSVWTELENRGAEPVRLELLSSVNLGGLTPFAADDAPDTLALTRIRSSWAQEGRVERMSIEDAHLERAWLPQSAVFERWGQVGSMPNRGWFPFAAVEDTRFGVVWAAELTHASSWQMEVGRFDNGLAISGGLADREFGHWMRDVRPGETFRSPEAILTVCRGTVDRAAQRLTDWTAERLDPPASEAELPVLFNEYCTSWGRPDERGIGRIVDRVRDLGLKYFVIDCGWYLQREDEAWWNTTGAWQVSPFLFPSGLERTLDRIREAGMLPGIWFEMESVGCCSPLFDRTDWMLQRDGVPLTVGERRFLDFRNPEVTAYLHERVIGFLARYRIPYVKFDYNDNIGMGADGAESLGEALRQQVEAVQAFYRRLREELPDTVIEVCASGGHRIVPSFMRLSSMASFSDAHECEEIPVIASNMHRMILPRQSQIWAVLHTEHSEQELYYKLTAGLLGRLCLSGDVLSFTGAQREIIRRAIAFYHEAVPVIREGESFWHGVPPTSWRHPHGWQAILREGREADLAVVHSFHGAPDTVRIPLRGKQRLLACCAREGIRTSVCGGELILTGLRELDGCAFLLGTCATE